MYIFIYLFVYIYICIYTCRYMYIYICRYIAEYRWNDTPLASNHTIPLNHNAILQWRNATTRQ